MVCVLQVERITVERQLQGIALTRHGGKRQRLSVDAQEKVLTWLNHSSEDSGKL
jgi:hypothetical protein